MKFYVTHTLCGCDRYSDGSVEISGVFLSEEEAEEFSNSQLIYHAVAEVEMS